MTNWFSSLRTELFELTFTNFNLPLSSSDKKSLTAKIGSSDPKSKSYHCAYVFTHNLTGKQYVGSSINSVCSAIRRKGIADPKN